MSELTKRAIKESFLRLINERPLNRITVKDIADDCGINRNTFYYHYSDIPALLEEVIHTESDRMVEQYPSIDSIEEGLMAAVGFAVHNKTAVMHIYHSVSRDVYERYMWECLDYIARSYMRSAAGDRNINHEDMEIVIRYTKSFCFGLIARWLEDDMRDDLISYFKRLCELKRGQLEELLDRCREE